MASNFDKYGDYSQQQNLSDKQCNHAGIGIGFALIGMAAGAAIALLLAPKAGDELRGDLRRGVDNARQTLGNVGGKVMPFRRPRQA
ncbi:MAG: YtxH domain-containing protein [Acidobacteriales bacterium]|nr:YtxH domain-containing protein [Terriglobales bacterium]